MGLPAVAKKVLSSVLPNLSEIAVKIHATMVIRATPHTSEGDNGTIEADIDVLRAKVANIEGRLENVESDSVSQADLIVRLTSHNATLARWVLILATALAISSGIAIAALVLAIF